MENSKRGTIPMQEKLKLSKSQGASTPAEKQRMQNIPYASAIGSIMYAVRCTRPDVAFAQNMTSRFQQNPGEEHWTAVKNILKYLRNTKDMFLVYGGTKQSIFATSSTDAEYIAAFDASKEAVWIRKFISGLGIVPTIEEPIISQTHAFGNTITTPISSRMTPNSLASVATRGQQVTQVVSTRKRQTPLKDVSNGTNTTQIKSSKALPKLKMSSEYSLS
ncbi:hypothetical protein Tco_0421360 [Tanacetum coccineum]